jgi:hypothetical protein
LSNQNADRLSVSNPSRSLSANPINAPTRRMRSACCARAASGQAAAPPSSVMNSRRFIFAVIQ